MSFYYYYYLKFIYLYINGNEYHIYYILFLNKNYEEQ